MQQLIKITSEPMRMVRFSQNARLINSDNIDMERRKAIARQSTFRNSAGQGNISVEDKKKINHTFSASNAKYQVPDEDAKPVAPQQKQMQMQIQAPAPKAVPQVSESVDFVSETAPVMAAPSEPVQDISAESRSNFTAQKGAFEMRVAKGDLTYLPPMVMTIVTQRPEVHIEYLGGFNYVPPKDGDSGNNVNLFT